MAALSFENTTYVYPLCEYAVTIELGRPDEENTLKRISAFNRSLLAKPFPGLYQTLPAYASLTVFFDPVIIGLDMSLPGSTSFEKVKNYLVGIRNGDTPETDQKTLPIIVPVCYGGDFGADLGFAAAHSQMDENELIRLYCEPLYTVAMIGFIPGFVYLAGLNKRLFMPRKDTPRRAVSPGAVGIGGGQTGIYPFETPGGWQIIGQTPLQLFDANRQLPVLFKAGDTVKFTSITPDEFEMLKADADKNT